MKVYVPSILGSTRCNLRCFRFPRFVLPVTSSWSDDCCLLDTTVVQPESNYENKCCTFITCTQTYMYLFSKTFQLLLMFFERKSIFLGCDFLVRLCSPVPHYTSRQIVTKTRGYKLPRECRARPQVALALSIRKVSGPNFNAFRMA